MALTELQRRRVWEAWFGGEVRANYFADLAGRYRRRHTMATWVTLFLSSGACVAMLGLRPAGYDWLPVGLTALTAAVSLYALVAHNQQRATESTDLQGEWARLSAAYQALWEGMYDEHSGAQLAALEERAIALSKTSNRFPVKPRVIRKWHRHAVAAHQARHAA